jgi:hypothetical protein
VEFRFSEAEFWESGLDQFNACVAGYNRANSQDGGKPKQTGIPDWMKGAQKRG